MPKGERRRLIKGFILGATHSIRIKLTPKRAETKTGNGKELTIVKAAAIEDKLGELGIEFKKVRRRTRYVDGSAYETFGRPVAPPEAANA